jgi:hypothetical protein
MPTHADQQSEAALATAQQRLLDGWRDVSTSLRTLAQSLGSAQSCVCGNEHECVQCAVLLHTIAWRIDELSDKSQPFRPASPDVVSEFGAIDSTEQMDTLRGRIENLAKTFAQIETLAREFRQGCSSASLPVIRRFADDLLVRCSALDEMLGFPRAASGRS